MHQKLQNQPNRKKINANSNVAFLPSFHRTNKFFVWTGLDNTEGAQESKTEQLPSKTEKEAEEPKMTSQKFDEFINRQKEISNCQFKKNSNIEK